MLLHLALAFLSSVGPLRSLMWGLLKKKKINKIVIGFYSNYLFFILYEIQYLSSLCFDKLSF